jgi:tetratricopeptide (TPR) repeat protein
MRKAALVILLTGLSAAVFAQNKGTGNAVPAKPLSAADSTRVKDLFFSALRQKTIDNTRLASELFGQVLAIDPYNDASMYELANLQKGQNNYQAAAPLLEKATAVNPDNEWYWLALADNCEKTNDLPKLLLAFDQLIRINPDKPEYYFGKAGVYAIQRKYDEAIKLYDKIETITGPTDELQSSRQKIYLTQGKVDKASDGLEKLIAANPADAKYYLMLAEVYNSNGLNDKALEVLNKGVAALDKEKNTGLTYGLLHMALADVYKDKKNFDSSFNERKIAFGNADVNVDQKVRIVLDYIPQLNDPKAKTQALELSRILTVVHPDNDKAFAVYGDMLVQNEKYREAKPVYKRSVELNAQSYQVHEQLVRIEMAESDFAGAIKDGENALSYFPNQAWMNYLVGIAWQQSKNYNKALGYLKNAAGLEATDTDMLSQCYSAMGDCYHSISDNKSSDEAYEKALSYNPDNAFTLNNYAYYLSLRNEKLDKAEAMSKHSTELQPNTASFEDTYAWILFRQKKYAEAKVWIEKSLAHDKEEGAVKTEHYGDILYFTGDANGALQNWQKAKKQGGASPAIDKKINEKKYSE